MENTSELMDPEEFSSMGILTENNSRPVASREEYDKLMVAYFTLRAIEALAAIFGNTLTIIAVSRYPILRTPTNMFIVGLAISDVTSGFIVYPMSTIVHYTANADGPQSMSWYNLCLTKEFMNMVTSLGNFYSIFLIGVDRAICLHFPVRYPVILTNNKAIKIIFCVFSILIISAAVLSFHFSLDDPPNLCDYKYILPPTVQTIGLAVLFGGVSVMTIIIYSKIGCLAIRNSRRSILRKMSVSTNSSVRSTGGNPLISSIQMKVTKMLFMVLGIYLLSYLPTLIISPFIPVTEAPIGMLILRYSCMCLWYCNTWVNPVIYAWKNNNFRRTFKNILGIAKKSQDLRTPSTTSDSAFAVHPPAGHDGHAVKMNRVASRLQTAVIVHDDADEEKCTHL